MHNFICFRCSIFLFPSEIIGKHDSQYQWNSFRVSNLLLLSEWCWLFYWKKRRVKSLTNQAKAFQKCEENVGWKWIGSEIPTTLHVKMFLFSSSKQAFQKLFVHRITPFSIMNIHTVRPIHSICSMYGIYFMLLFFFLDFSNILCEIMWKWFGNFAARAHTHTRTLYRRTDIHVKQATIPSTCMVRCTRRFSIFPSRSYLVMEPFKLLWLCELNF